MEESIITTGTPNFGGGGSDHYPAIALGIEPKAASMTNGRHICHICHDLPRLL